MRPMAAHNRIPTVPKDELALDQTLKHLRKLRWIGNEIEARRILEVLDAQGRSDAARPPAPLEPVLSFSEPLLSPPLIDGSLEVVAIVAPTVSRKMKMTDPSRHKIAKVCPDPLPAWLALAASPGAARVSLCARARIRMSVRQSQTRTR
jgi:hypothetical protein